MNKCKPDTILKELYYGPYDNSTSNCNMIIYSSDIAIKGITLKVIDTHDSC